MANQRTPRQQSIPGTEPNNPDVAAAIEEWLDAVERAKAASERAKATDDAVLSLMISAGITHYPYTDAKGKRQWRVVDTTPRARSVSNRSELPAGAEADEPEVSESETPAQEQVTHRRVPRATALGELAAIADETRARDQSSQEQEREQGEAAVDGALRPARSYEDDDAEGGDGAAIAAGAAGAAGDEAHAPPSEPKEPERFELLELHDEPSAPVQPVESSAAQAFDAELLAQGKCALRSRTSNGNRGEGCALDVGHSGLHESHSHRWKARRPKPVETQEQETRA